MVVSKEKKSEYNRAAYLKRKAKKVAAAAEPEDKIEELLIEDNIVHDEEPAQPPADLVPTEPQEYEISQEDYNKFLEWKTNQSSFEEAKKKIDTDPSYLLNVLKTLGVALAPALIGVFQRALVKTLEQQTNSQETRSQNSMPQSAVTGNTQWSPLDPVA